MFMTVVTYRILVILTFLVLVLSLSLDYFWQKDLVEFVAEFAESLLDIGVIRNNFLNIFFTLMLLLAIYSFVGLLRLQKHARYVFLAVFLFLVPIYLLLGVSVQSGLSRLFSDVGLIMSGVLIALMFTQPVKYYFDR